MTVIESEPGWVRAPVRLPTPPPLPRSMAPDRDFWQEAAEAERRRRTLSGHGLDLPRAAFALSVVVLFADVLSLLARV